MVSMSPLFTLKDQPKRTLYNVLTTVEPFSLRIVHASDHPTPGHGIDSLQTHRWGGWDT